MHITGFTAMDAQTPDVVCVSEKEQLTAPSGWTKKLIPASAKSITLRKYDVVFIAPDGQELKSKWHLIRYLKAHPGGPALSEFIWSSGEEAPIRRSARFATKEASEDNKSTLRKKGKRDASEMENDQEKMPSRKRTKKAGDSAGSDEKSVVRDAADNPENDEIMHEATACDNEANQEVAPVEGLKDESNDANLVEVEASNEAAIEKAVDDGLDEPVKAEDTIGTSATIGGEHEAIQVEEEGLDKQVKAETDIVSSAIIEEEHEAIQVEEEGLDKQVEAETDIVSSTIIEEEHEEIQIKVLEVKESLTDNELHAENENEAAQGTGTLIAPADELKVEEVTVENKVMELREHLDQKFEENEGVSCKTTVVTSVIEELGEGNDKSLEPSMQREQPLESPMQREQVLESPMQKQDLVERLMEKEEQERLTHVQNSPLKMEQIKDKSPSEFSSSPVRVIVANE